MGTPSMIKKKKIQTGKAHATIFNQTEPQCELIHIRPTKCDYVEASDKDYQFGFME